MTAVLENVFDLLLILTVVATTVTDCSLEDPEWEAWKKGHSLHYRSAREEQIRYEIYKLNQDFITGNNLLRHETGFTVGLNHFADMSLQEIASNMLTLRPPSRHTKGKQTAVGRNSVVREEVLSLGEVAVDPVPPPPTVGPAETLFGKPEDKESAVKPLLVTIYQNPAAESGTAVNTTAERIKSSTTAASPITMPPLQDGATVPPTTTRRSMTTKRTTPFYTKASTTKRANVTTTRKANVTFSELKLDWRESGAVTLVKNQTKRCGACWAFSVTGALEGRLKLKTGRLVSLSEQNLLDCNTYANYGCNGGWMNDAMKYVRDSGGINTERAYPYLATQGRCRFDNKTTAKFAPLQVKTFEWIQPLNETALVEALKSGPVISAVDAHLPSYIFYKSGIYDDPQCTTRVNHGILIIGYGTDKSSGRKYWLVKNSWGERWGERGYMRMARGKNNCGLLSHPSYPVLL